MMVSSVFLGKGQNKDQGANVLAYRLRPNRQMNELTTRGVQYVHWVMHKCIMAKVGGEKIKRKGCKKLLNFWKTGGKFVKVGGK